MKDSPLILVIEESPTQAASLEFHLTRQGYRTLLATRADAALDTARAHCPDLVIAETTLPGIDGFALCREFAACSKPVPVLIFSSRDDPDSMALALSCGAAGFVAKDDGAERLLARIGEILAEFSGEDVTVPDRFAPAPGLRVLVADDNKVNLMLADWVLKHAGHEATAVCCGEEAINQARAERYDLILMDIEMPDLDGAEAARRLRENGGKSAGAPILALSGHSAKELGSRGWDVFDGYLPKPLELAAFNRAAAQALAKRLP